MNYAYSVIKKIEDWVIILSTISVTTIITIGAIARYFFSYNLAGVEELLGISGAWMFFIGAIRASRTKTQISADMISSFLKSEKSLNIASLIRNSLAVTVCGLFSYWSIEFVSWEITSGGYTPALRIPLLVGKISLFLSCIGMLSYAIRDLIQDLKNIKKA